MTAPAAGPAAGPVVVGQAPDGRGRGALHLAAQLARSAGRGIVVCCVVPDRWESPSLARVDAEYAAHLRSLAGDALDDARDLLGDPGETAYVVRTGRSVPAALLAEAAERDAPLLAVGSAQGAWGHIATGSVSDRLMHSAELPLALAPRGFSAGPSAVVERVTVALDGSDSCTPVLLAAARVAARIGASLRVVTFGVRARPMRPTGAGLHAEDQVVAAWREQVTSAQAAAVAALSADGPVEQLVVEGRDWSDALDGGQWRDGDVLVVGSSRDAALPRVFLGSTATRIVRAAPVPAVLLPAST